MPKAATLLSTDCRARAARGPAEPAAARQHAAQHGGESLTAVLERLDRVAAEQPGRSGDDRVSVSQLLDGLGAASFPSVMLAPALLVVSPASGIPLLSSLCGLTIALIAAQTLVGKRVLWLPRFILRRSVEGRQLRRALDWLKAPARWIDRRTGRRLSWAARRPFSFVLLLLCLLCGLVMPFLELVPFTSSILGTAVTTLALALMVRDGLLALLGMTIIGGTVFAGLNLTVI